MRAALLLTLLSVIALVCTPAGAASSWNSYRFDGSRFAKGGGSGAIMAKDGFLPVPAGNVAPREDQLPTGTGAVAILCFRSHGGGSPVEGSFAPISGVAVTVTGGSLTVAARTDADGYLVLALPPGSYQITLFGFSTRVRVERGKTTLAALRGGKRMIN